MALKRTIKELANYFDQELHQILPLKVLANGSLIYKNYFVKKLHNNNWGVFNVLSNDLKEQYHLKSCAVMAAKAFNTLCWPGKFNLISSGPGFTPCLRIVRR